MKLIIFNINIYNFDKNIDNIYGRFFREKKGDNPEQYNFCDYNGYCYGYANLKKGVVDLSSINFSNDSSTYDNNATILWVYEKDNTHFLLGWYKNATVYNFLQKNISYSPVGRDLYYNVRALSSDCYLLPKDGANIEVSVEFKDKLFCITDKNNTNFSNILSYIDNYNGEISNIHTESIINDTIPSPPDNPILLFKRGYIYLYEENNFLDALKYFNSALLFKDKLEDKHIIDIHYLRAVSLQNLYNFKGSIDDYKNVISFIGYDLNIYKTLVYLHLSSGDYVGAISYCDEIIKKDTTIHIDSTLLDEINCLKADCLINLEKYNDAKLLLKNIITLSNNENMKNYCQNILNTINNI